MANIRIDLNHAPLAGETITFKAPCDAKDIAGLIIYYPSENGVTTSREFTLNDANGGDIGAVDNIFAAGAIVKVILDIDVNNAYVQNPDTNTYLEGRFENKAPKSHVSDTTAHITAAERTAWNAKGDMLASVYDPQGKAQDVFAYADTKTSVTIRWW